MTTQTIQGVVNAMSKEQKDVLYFLIGQAVDDALSGKTTSSVAQSGLGDELSHSAGRTIKDVVSSYTSEQKDTLAFLMGKAVEDALGTPSEEELEQSIFDETEEFLAHYGVKGMKWGVRRYQNKDGSLKPRGRKRQAKSERRDRDSDIRKRTPSKDTKAALAKSKAQYKSEKSKIKKDAKADRAFKAKLFAKSYLRQDLQLAAYQRRKGSAVNEYVGGFSEKLKNIGKAQINPKFRREYNQGLAEAFAVDLAKSIEKKGATSKSGNLTYTVTKVKHNPITGLPVVRIKATPIKRDVQEAVKHAADEPETEEFEIEMTPVYDDRGLIIDFKIDDDTVVHSLTPDVDDFLAHYGVKGMKWGVRRSQAALDRAAGRKPKRQTKDQKARSERKKLSDKRRTLESSELDSLVKRLENEKKLKKLVEEDLTPGKAFAKNVLETAGKRALPTMIAGATLYGVKTAIDHEYSSKALADAVFRGGAKKK